MSKTLKFDALIIGSGFDALLTGLKLQSQGLSVALIESDETTGGLYRPVKVGDSLIESHINFIPAGEEVKTVLNDIQQYLPQLKTDVINLGPITFQNGQTQPFLGFGETDIQAMDEYLSFLPADQLQPSLGLGALTQKMRELLNEKILSQSEVTALEVEPETAVMINGSQKIVASTIYYFDNPHKLSKLLTASKHSIPKNFVQKLSKIPLWTAVNLTFQHPTAPTESLATHVLYGAKDQPCVGRFRSDKAFANEPCSSQWVSFVSQETAADSELLGATIREMKKQIKRMYPHFFESVSKEFIFIAPDAYGTLPQGLMGEHGSVPKAPTLKVSGRYYVDAAGVLGDFLSLKSITEAIKPVEEPQHAQLM